MFQSDNLWYLIVLCYIILRIWYNFSLKYLHISILRKAKQLISAIMLQTRKWDFLWLKIENVSNYTWETRDWWLRSLSGINVSSDEFCKKYSSRISNRYLLYTKDLRKDGEILMTPVYMTGLLWNTFLSKCQRSCAQLAALCYALRAMLCAMRNVLCLMYYVLCLMCYVCNTIHSSTHPFSVPGNPASLLIWRCSTLCT